MTALETQLYEDVKDNPEDWSLRFDLADRLYERDERALAAQVIGEAPRPPESEEDTLRAVTYCAEENLHAAFAMAQGYLAEHPESGPLHAACARLLSRNAQAEEAAEHYRQAVALDAELRDGELEEWLLNEAGIHLELPATREALAVAEEVSVVKEGARAKDEDVKPIAEANISSLRERRKETSREAVSAKPPPPDLVAVGEGDPAVAHAVDHYAVEDLHPAETQGLAPPPGVRAGATDRDRIHREALESTGLMTSNSFSTNDIRRLQPGHSQLKEKVSAMGVAIAVHIVVFVILGLIVIAVPRRNPPEIVAVAAVSDQVVPEIEKKEVQEVKKPNPSSAARVNVLTVANTSAVAVPVVIDPIDTIEPIGAGNDFGMAMAFGAQGAGNVSFFGSKTKANKVVFVVDSSASMNSKGQTGLSKHQLMKDELSKTVKGLSSGVEFQIIFFSGPCWFVGDKVPNSKDKNDDWHEWEGKNFWHYKDGEPDQIPVGKYRQATPGMIRKTIKEIEETPSTYGTDWRVPLQMAMKMEPDVIYFMTDGAVGKHPVKPPVVEDVLKFNKKYSNAKINSICLMVPKAMDDMGEMSDKTRGELTLVLEDGTPVRGSELKKHLR